MLLPIDTEAHVATASTPEVGISLRKRRPRPPITRSMSRGDRRGFNDAEKRGEVSRCFVLIAKGNERSRSRALAPSLGWSLVSCERGRVFTAGTLPERGPDVALRAPGRLSVRPCLDSKAKGNVRTRRRAFDEYAPPKEALARRQVEDYVGNRAAKSDCLARSGVGTGFERMSKKANPERAGTMRRKTKRSRSHGESRIAPTVPGFEARSELTTDKAGALIHCIRPNGAAISRARGKNDHGS